MMRALLVLPLLLVACAHETDWSKELASSRHVERYGRSPEECRAKARSRYNECAAFAHGARSATKAIDCAVTLDVETEDCR